MVSTRTLIVALAMLAAIPAARAQDARADGGCVYDDLHYSVGSIVCVPGSNIALRCVPGGSPGQGSPRPTAPFWDSGVAGWPAEQPGQHSCFTPGPPR